MHLVKIIRLMSSNIYSRNHEFEPFEKRDNTFTSYKKQM